MQGRLVGPGAPQHRRIARHAHRHVVEGCPHRGTRDTANGDRVCAIGHFSGLHHLHRQSPDRVSCHHPVRVRWAAPRTDPDRAGRADDFAWPRPSWLDRRMSGVHAGDVSGGGSLSIPRSKFGCPAVPVRAIARPRLVEVLRQPDWRVALVTGGPATGKTVAVAQWFGTLDPVAPGMGDTRRRR